MPKKKEIKYYVIGGQYRLYNYGGTPTLLGAKRLATKNEEYWDNWQGWHKPAIYRAEDCVLRNGCFGEDYYPKLDCYPLLVWDNAYNAWFEREYVC